MSAPSRLAAVTAAILLGCSGGPAADSTPEPEETPCLTGLLRSSGTEGFAEVVLREDGAGTTVLTGDERDTLMRLTGALVTVCGPVTEGLRHPEMGVSNWTLRSMDGQEAVLGRLAETADGWALAPVEGERDSVALGAVPDALGELTGRTVWVAGGWSGSVFQVASFGLVR